MRVQVVDHDLSWRIEFEAETKRIVQALAGIVVRLHHIGSTAIPGMPAKPIIDLLMEVDDIQLLDQKTPAIEGLGYEAMGEFGISGRRYFRKNNVSGIRTHQVHAFQAGSSDVERHLAYRDYMIAHPLAAQSYGKLKQRLAHRHPDDIMAYMDGKDVFVKEHEAKALAWRLKHPKP